MHRPERRPSRQPRRLGQGSLIDGYVDLLVVGSPHDPHIGWVRREATAAGMSTACVDVHALWHESGSFDPATGRLSVGDLALDRCALVWVRRTHRTPIGRMNLADTAFARGEFQHLLLGALDGCGAEWHSRPERLTAASYKPAQLAWAARDGRLAVPETLVTSSPDAARAFLGDDPSRFVVKPLGGGTIETEQGFDAIFTTRVSPALLESVDDLRHAPCIIQRFVPRAFDVRINLVGDALFATRIDTRGIAAAEVDSRQVFYTDYDYAAIDPPPAVAAACRAMCAYFGIGFGAFDFALDRDGGWFFLELNPWGQWAWVEEMTGAPIAAAFASFFAARLAARADRGDRAVSC